MPTILILLAALLAAASAPARAQDTRAAIIDTAWDTRPYLDRLKANGVLVIGRYLARCPQPERNIPQKRLKDQGPITDPNSEVSRILAAGMAILSIYQYNNDHKNKFLGRDRDGNPLPDAACRQTGRERTPKAEAALDARAAVTQAKALGQPRGSAIYFGVDIAFDRGDDVTRRAMVEYFREVRRIVARGGYRLGAYGNGDALEVLLDERLVDYTWISASRAFPGSTRFHNSGRWHFFQNRVNLEWFGGSPGACGRGLGLDTNIKNPRFADEPLGFWTRRGVVLVPAERTRAIHAARRFVCDGDARIRKAERSGPRDLIDASLCQGGRAVPHRKTIDYMDTARLGRRVGNLVEVDYDDDGTFDGWTAVSNLTPSFDVKPEWIFDRNARGRARCP